jgi:hypothetical protein
VLFQETSPSSVHRRASVAHATTRVVRTVTTRQACTTVPTATGHAGRFRPWAVPLSQGLGPEIGPPLFTPYCFFEIVPNLKFQKFVYDSKIHVKLYKIQKM